MENKREKQLVSNRLINPLSLFDEDFWGLNLASQTGLSIYEDVNHVCVDANLPGLKPEEIEITFQKGVLWIRGEKKEESKDKKNKYYRKASSSFSYQVVVPGSIEEKKDPEVTYKEGVLKIAFTKAPQSEPKKIPIRTK